MGIQLIIKYLVNLIQYRNKVNRERCPQGIFNVPFFN